MTDTPAAKPQRKREIFRMPHMQVGETRTVDAPAQRGIIAHKDYLATTACGEEKPTVLVTRRADLVRCPDCKTAMAND